MPKKKKYPGHERLFDMYIGKRMMRAVGTAFSGW